MRRGSCESCGVAIWSKGVGGVRRFCVECARRRGLAARLTPHGRAVKRSWRLAHLAQDRAYHRRRAEEDRRLAAALLADALAHPRKYLDRVAKARRPLRVVRRSKVA